MSSRVALAAVALASFITAGCAQRSSQQVAELHRIVFSTSNPGHPLNAAVANAQIQLATAYVNGHRVERDVEFGCGLALNVRELSEHFPENEALREQTQRAISRLCVGVIDRQAAGQLAVCPVLGVKPQTLKVGTSRLTLRRAGTRLENSTGVHDDPWIADCGDIVVSPRVVRAEVPPGSPYVPTFLEFFLWRQEVYINGRAIPGRRLEWKVVEMISSGLPQAEGAVLLELPGASIWPIPSVPDSIAHGPTLRLLPSGQVQWHFEGAPQFGSGTFGLLGGPQDSQRVEASARTSATGRVTGRLTMTTGDVLPGVTVTLSNNGTTTTAVTGADGRFVVEAFVDGSSATLSASLAGFQTTNRGFTTRPGGTVNLGDIRLPVSCLSIVDFVATGLREEASRAQRVTHLRVESVQPVREWTLDKSCYVGSEVTAVVVHDSRGRRLGTRIRFVPIKSPSEPPYVPDDEIVVALDQDRASRQYFSWGYGYRVSNGVVALNAPFDEFEEEIPVGVLFERLKDAR